MNNHLNFSMMKLIQALTPLLFTTGLLFANLEKELQTQFILAASGDTITIPKGHHKIQGTLSIEGKENLVIQGVGMDVSILSFSNQSEAPKESVLQILKILPWKNSRFKIPKAMLSRHNTRMELFLDMSKWNGPAGQKKQMAPTVFIPFNAKMY